VVVEAVTKVEPSPWQDRILVMSEDYNVAMLGGRGPGKSHAIAFLILQHLERYRDKARCLFVRRSFPGALDFVGITRTLLVQAFGPQTTYSQATHIWSIPYGYFEVGMLDDASDFARYQGRSFSLVAVDELTQYPEPSQVDLLWSCLRSSAGIPTRMIVAANPGLAGHAWVNERYNLVEAADWQPFHEPASGREWVRATGTFRDNPFLDPGYQDNLVAATGTDEGLQKAWLTGDWSAVAAGAFFATVLSSENQVDPWPTPEESGWWVNAEREGWELFLSYDHGTSAPAVCHVFVKSPGATGPDGKWYPRGSLIVVEELAFVAPGTLDKGLGLTVPVMASEILVMTKRWGMEAVGAADDAIFSDIGSAAGSIATEFSRQGIRFRRAGKGSRIGGWEVVRQLMSNAGTLDLPGLYISRSCTYFWRSVPYLGRNPRRPDDLDTTAADHAADSVRYGVIDAGWRRPANVPFRLG